MPTILIAFVVFAIAVAGAGFQGFQMGEDKKQVEWDKAIAVAVAKTEKEKQAQVDAANATAKTLEGKLAKQKGVARELTASLEAHIKAASFKPECRLTGGLLTDWNDAARGYQNPSSGSVPDKVPGKPAVPK